MNFYFCERCGKRITDADILQGLAKNKKLTGVFCEDCAIGVLTVETLPMTPDEARQILRTARGSQGSNPQAPPTGHQAVRPASVKTATRPSAKSSAHAGRSPRWWSVALAAGGCAIVLALVVLLMHGDAGKAPSSTATSPVMPAGSKEVQQQPAKPPAAEQPKETQPQPTEKPEAPSPEQRASKAWDDLQAILAREKDVAAQKTAIQGFLDVHGQSSVAARARQLMRGLEAPGPTVPNAGEPVSRASTNVPVANAGFEEGAKTPSGWHMTAGAEFSRDTTVAHAGTCSARIHQDNESKAGFYQNIAARPGASFEVRVWVRSEGLSKAAAARGTVSVVWRTATGDERAHPQATIEDPQIESNQWHEVTGRIAVPAETVSMRLRLGLNYSAGTIWFDDVSIRTVEP